MISFSFFCAYIETFDERFWQLKYSWLTDIEPKNRHIMQILQNIRDLNLLYISRKKRSELMDKNKLRKLCRTSFKCEYKPSTFNFNHKNTSTNSSLHPNNARKFDITQQFTSLYSRPSANTNPSHLNVNANLKHNLKTVNSTSTSAVRRAKN